eukprot:CAMPEP_0119553350 /NCGR_PEP_ID=MMETSP1352-20130426/6124_1 /TAXON_ID=265584 /ORGANISM="Stauroneis constricta, Strain CCMP1120" /LENGTH=350 /DNA_ID=CAMNT_0007599743 /DNA_START=66 /DNA_END=1118 /DNA_ORIENTATION=-
MDSLSTAQQVVASILAYSFCSGTLVLVNKLTLHHLPFPSLIVVVQLVACVIMVYGAEMLKVVKVDPIKWEHVKPYLLYIFFFSTGVYTNMRSLEISNVETVIVFRALSPCVVAFLDVMFLGREWPSPRGWAGLLTLVLGAYGYASFDEKFQSQGWVAYSWPTIYLFIIALEMAYGKKIVKSVPLETLSGPVIYTNLLGILPMMVLASVKSEYTKFWDFWWSADENEAHMPPIAIFLLVLGSLIGAGIGYSAWWCRSLISATSFTLIGVLNKCLTILLNIMVWDKHAAPGGIACLFLCLVGGIIYQQPPMRNANKTAEPSTQEDDPESGEEKKDLIETTQADKKGDVKQRK